MFINCRSFDIKIVVNIALSAVRKDKVCLSISLRNFQKNILAQVNIKRGVPNNPYVFFGGERGILHVDSYWFVAIELPSFLLVTSLYLMPFSLPQLPYSSKVLKMVQAWYLLCNLNYQTINIVQYISKCF